MSGTYYLLMYDITNERTLQKVARNLEQHGYIRINYSVWFGWNDPVKNPVLKKKLIKMLQNKLAEGSRLYFLPVAEKDFRKIRRHNGRRISELEYWTGDLATQFF
jgi:CRISPR-associated endonuclease Cas2